MDVFTLPSILEGFPQVLLEAFAQSCPVVATRIRGCRQVVDHGRTGRLVPVRDVDALADAIGALATDAGLRRSLGEAARVKAQREFDQQRVIDTTLAVYESLLERRALVA